MQFKAACKKLNNETFFKVLSESFNECCNVNSKSKLNNVVVFTSMLDILNDEKQNRKVTNDEIDKLLGKMISTLGQRENAAGKAMPPEFEVAILAAIDKIVPMSEKPKMKELKAEVAKQNIERRAVSSPPEAIEQAPTKGKKKLKSKYKVKKQSAKQAPKEEEEWEKIDIPTDKEMKQQQTVEAPSKTPRGVLSRIGKFFGK